MNVTKAMLIEPISRVSVDLPYADRTIRQCSAARTDDHIGGPTIFRAVRTHCSRARGLRRQQPCLRPWQATPQGIRQPQVLIARFEQRRPAVGVAVWLEEAYHDRLSEQIFEDKRLSCGIVSHAKASCMWESACRNDFLPHQRPSFFRNS
jgi:hypothetical protein